MCWEACAAVGIKASSLADPNSTLAIIGYKPEPDGIVLQWSGLTNGFAFTVETIDSLTGSSWLPVPGNVWPVPGNSWKNLLPLDRGPRFYRVSRQDAQSNRGALLSATSIGVFSPDAIQSLFKQWGIPLTAGVAVHAYKIVYETVNPFDLKTIASGLLALPDQPTNRLPLVSYQHGTLVKKTGVPSALQGLESVAGIALASSGYLAVLPDYIGLGDSPGLHPFVHAKSEANAVIDLLRAARRFSTNELIALNGQLFLIGYSEGGHATMATHREIEASYTNEFRITASSPQAGPYDLSGVVLNDFLSDRAMPNPYYFLYLLVAYQSVYHLAGSLSEMLLPPYDTILPPLLDGEHDSSEINSAIGTSFPSKLVKPELLAALRNDPNHPIRAALRDNDLYNWTPLAPLRLYHCAADQDVLFANSQVAYDSFKARGAASVELLGADVQLDHTSCAPLSLLGAKQWFDSLRDQ